MRDLLFALHGYFISPIITLLFYVILVYVIIGWLFVAGVLQGHNPTARSIYGFLESIVEPLVRPIRQIVPPLGQLDLSVLVLVLMLLFARDFAIPRLIMLFPA